MTAARAHVAFLQLGRRISYVTALPWRARSMLKEEQGSADSQLQTGPNALLSVRFRSQPVPYQLAAIKPLTAGASPFPGGLVGCFLLLPLTPGATSLPECCSLQSDPASAWRNFPLWLPGSGRIEEEPADPRSAS